MGFEKIPFFKISGGKSCKIVPIEDTKTAPSKSEANF